MKRIYFLILALVVLNLDQIQAQKAFEYPRFFCRCWFWYQTGFPWVSHLLDWPTMKMQHIGTQPDLVKSNSLKRVFHKAISLDLITYNYASATIPLPLNKHTLGISVISSGDDALEETIGSCGLRN